MKNKDIWTDQYLDGALTEAELEVFRQQLQTDKELQLALALQRQGRALWSEKAAGDEAAFRQLLTIPSAMHFAPESRMQAEAPAVKGGRKVVLMRLAAAAAVILAVFAGLKWYASERLPLETILAQHYAPAATPATLSGNEYAMQEAFASYRNKQYETAVQLFGAVSTADPQYAEAMLFAGYAHYESGQYLAAAAAFERVVQTGDVRFAPNAEWHRLLALFAAKPASEEAKALLLKLRNDSTHPFHQEAVSFEKQLNNPLRRLAK